MAADNVIDISIGAVELRYVKELPSAAQVCSSVRVCFWPRSGR